MCSDLGQADVAIVGGGIAGLASALELSENGYSVTLVDAAQIGSGSTGWCAGILSASTTIDLQVLERQYGRDAAKRIASAVMASLSRYRERFGQADWQYGKTMYLAAKRADVKTMRAEQQVHEEYGMSSRFLNAEQIDRTWTGFYSAVEADAEHAVNPTKLIAAFREELARRGIRLLEGTKVENWQANGGVVTLNTSAGLITANHLVIATGLRTTDDSLQPLMLPAIGHIVVLQPNPAVAELVHRDGIIASWDSLQLYHYVRYMADGRMLIGGEEAAGTCAPTALDANDKHVRNLLAWAQEHHKFPLTEPERAWRASLIVPADGMPFIRSEDREGSRIITVVTDGLPMAMTMASSIVRLIQTGNDWLATCLSPRRKLPWEARLLARVRIPALRRLALRLAFAALRVRDAV